MLLFLIWKPLFGNVASVLRTATMYVVEKLATNWNDEKITIKKTIHLFYEGVKLFCF